MWRVTGIFMFMCGVLTTHLWQEDWSVVSNILTPSTQANQASVIISRPATRDLLSSSTDSIINNMSLEEKVGQLLLLGHWSEDYYQHTVNMIKVYHIGGIIIMKSSDDVVPSIPDWTKSWQQESKIPLLISIDQEGGEVSRIRASGYNQTSQRSISSTGNAFQIGSERGDELHSLGINTNLAPVMDFASSSDAFLYNRSFASSTVVDSFAQAIINGHASSGVLAIPKHFPGHAGTPDDSHYMLPVVDITAAEFPEHVTQFSSLLTKANIDAIMTAHVQFPKLDNVYPATLSYEILTRQLRHELNFDGVIITDDMTMGAITNQWTTDDAAVQAIKAGADMILFAAEPNAAISAHAHILKAIKDGEISEARIDESLRRILQLKQNQGLE